ncbi:MAG: hypothetical protein KJ667_00220 [Alphaproteobacteria bacterium]|nr:hypothetical protein [Alphaproteobacteria bacterium]
MAKHFAAVALGGGLVLMSALPLQHDDTVPEPVPQDTAPPVVEVQNPLQLFCPAPTEIRRDEQQRPWVHVDTLTRDGVALSFDLNLTYQLNGADPVTTITDCDHISRHILGLAKIVYAEQILAHDYADLPVMAPTLPRAFAVEMNTRLRSLMGFAAPEIVGMGVNNVTAPGLNREQAQVMMTQGLILSRYTAPRLLALSHDNQAVEYKVDFDYQIAPSAYDHFGPHPDAIRAAITEAIDTQLKATSAQWTASCMQDGKLYIESETYAAAAAQLAAATPGVYLLGLNISAIEFPADIAPPARPARTTQPVCAP